MYYNNYTIFEVKKKKKYIKLIFFSFVSEKHLNSIFLNFVFITSGTNPRQNHLKQVKYDKAGGGQTNVLKNNQQELRSLLCTSLDVSDLELLPSAPPGSCLALAHRPGHTARGDAQGGGVSRAVRHVLTHASIGGFWKELTQPKKKTSAYL